jgi:hypothetical protein
MRDVVRLDSAVFVHGATEGLLDVLRGLLLGGSVAKRCAGSSVTAWGCTDTGKVNVLKSKGLHLKYRCRKKILEKYS